MNLSLKFKIFLSNINAKYFSRLYATYLTRIAHKDILCFNCFVQKIGPIVIRKNFGDDLNVFLFERLSNKKVINSPFLKNTPILCIGSILESGSAIDRPVVVWGTGAMYGQEELYNKNIEVRAVRGPLTREFLKKNGIECPEIYGDPALLLPYAYPSPRKRLKDGPKKLGIIPHYLDFNEPLYQKLEKIFPHHIYINFGKYKNWESIIDEINSCDYIVSSSLHGLIIADAYNIPNVWITRNGINIGGGKFKYLDYQLAVRSEKEPQEPVFLESEHLEEQLTIKLRDWMPIEIDLSPLISSCPFELHISEISK